MVGCGVINDVGSHLIDLVRSIGGSVSSTHGELGHAGFGLEVDDHAVVTMRFESGALGLAEAANSTDGGAATLEILGTDGSVTCLGTVMGGEGRIDVALRGQEPETRAVDALNLYVAEVESFGRAVRGEGPLLVSGQDGLAGVRVIAQARGW